MSKAEVIFEYIDPSEAIAYAIDNDPDSAYDILVELHMAKTKDMGVMLERWINDHRAIIAEGKADE